MFEIEIIYWIVSIALIIFFINVWASEGELPSNKCKHYKNSGSKYPDNMKSIIKFDDYPNSEDKNMSYGVSECRECQTRAFQCLFYHWMCTSDAEYIDKFIAHEVTLDELIEYFDKPTKGGQKRFRYKVLT